MYPSRTNSPEWVCVPEITHNNEWFLWNTNARGWTPFHTGTHNRFYFFHNAFFLWEFRNTSEITLKSLEIMVRGQKSQLSVEQICIKLGQQWVKWLVAFSSAKMWIILSEPEFVDFSGLQYELCSMMLHQGDCNIQGLTYPPARGPRASKTASWANAFGQSFLLNHI